MALGDPERNLETLERWTVTAAREEADLAFFPEMFITGYAENFMIESGYVELEKLMSLAEPVPGPTTQRLAELSRDMNIAVCAGLLERDGADLYNTQVLIDPQIEYPRMFRKIQVGPGELGGRVQSGDEFPVYEVGGVPTGCMICRDKSHPEVARILALEGAELILTPHASTVPPRMGFTTWSLKICAVRAMENGCFVIANNNIYDCPMIEGRSLAGYNFAIDPYGEVIHCDSGPPDTEKIAFITVDRNKVDERRNWEGSGFNLYTRRPDAYSRLVSPPPGPRN
jgi:(R)-amidase